MPSLCDAEQRDYRLYLEDILSAIKRIKEYAVDGETWFLEDSKTQDAIIRQFSIIGEASSKVPAAIKATRPTIPWKRITGMRNIIVHDYAETDLPTIWETVEKDLPHLQQAIERLLRELPRSPL